MIPYSPITAPGHPPQQIVCIANKNRARPFFAVTDGGREFQERQPDATNDLEYTEVVRDHNNRQQHREVLLVNKPILEIDSTETVTSSFREQFIIHRELPARVLIKNKMLSSVPDVPGPLWRPIFISLCRIRSVL
ncbi:hypothetical protein J6590_059881 [Homalodisca vitripennis]|nr:hypothetical protein J6590_059881 [Homalodisca vitripennis]